MCVLSKSGNTGISKHRSGRLTRREQEQENSSEHSRHGHREFPPAYEPSTSVTGIIDRGTSNERSGYTKYGYDRVVAVCLARI